MKKICPLFMALLVAMSLFTSCKNDDIQIDNIGTLNVSVTTTTLYDDLGYARSIQNILGKYPNYRVGTIVLLYNESGMLVDKQVSMTNTFQVQNVSFEKVQEGLYTLIAIETMYDTDDGDDTKAIFWKLSDEEKLHTVRMNLKNADSTVYWYGVLGVVSTSVYVDGDSQASLTPRMVGCLLSFQYENFANSPYVMLGFELKNACSGFFLSPEKKGNEHLYYESYNVSHTWNRRGYFYDNSNKLEDSDEIDVIIMETGSQNYCFGASEASQISSTTWNFTAFPSTSEFFTFNEGERYVGYCYYNEDYNQLDTFLGTESEFESWYKNHVTLYVEPYLKWGATVSEVKNAMNGYTVGNGGELVNRNDYYILWYYGKNRESEIDYVFTSQTRNLIEAIVFLDSSEIGEDEIQSYFEKQGYSYIGSGGNFKRYSMDRGMIYIDFFLNNDNDWVIQYYKAGSSARVNTSRTNNYKWE